MILFIFLLILSSIGISYCNGSQINRKIGQLLLENLNHFHLGLPLTSSGISNNSATVSIKRKRSNSNLISSLLPDYINLQIISFIEPKSKASLSATCSYFNKIDTEAVRKNLEKFGPYFVFRESWMNQIMNQFITETFNSIGIEKCNDIRIHDAIYLSNIKYINNESNSFLSADTRYLLLSFMFEIVYGPDEPISTCKDQWKTLLVQKLIKYDMPACIEVYLNNLNEEIDDNNDISFGNALILKSQVKDIVRFLGSKRCDKSELLEIYTKLTSENDQIDISQYAPELKTGLSIIFQEKILVMEDIEDFLSELIYEYSFSQALLDRFPDNSVFLIHLLGYQFRQKETKLMRALYKKFDGNVNVASVVEGFDAKKYLWTRDHLNPFDINTFMTNFENTRSAIVEFSSSSSPNILQIEIIHQIIQSGVYNFQLICPFSESFKLLLIMKEAKIAFKIILKESPTPVNMFEALTNGKYKHVFNYEIASLEMLIIYIQNLRSDDPLQLFFVNPENLLLLKPLIVDRFNLKNRYKFGEEIWNVNMLGVGDNQLAVLSGKTLTFKQIVDLLFIRNEDFMSIFTSKSPAEIDLNSIDEESESEQVLPVSFYKFLYQGVLETE